MRTMYDGINRDAAGIRASFPYPAMVAGYINGAFAWSPAAWALFPHAEHVTISVTASANEGDVLDVEYGDATPAQAEGWIRMRKAAGLYRPTIYCSLSTVPAVRQGTGPYVLGQDYDLWVADYDNSTGGVYPGAAAKQWQNTAGWDASVVYDAGWPHRSAPTAPPAPPAAPPSPVPDSDWPANVTLKQGDTGNAVKVLQQHLHDSGQYGARGLEPIDGDFGPATLAAVRNFQADKRLTVDGIAGPATRAALGVR